MSKLNSILLLITGLFLGCQDEADSTTVVTPPADQYLISATRGTDMSAESLRALAQTFGQREIAALLKYNVRTFTLRYTTHYKGNPIEASGLILLPSGLKDKAPMVSLQHGTTFAKSEAPSSTGGFTGTELFASAGYITLVPDFIGYGSSVSVFHPYYDKQHSAMTVIDMVKAAKEFLRKDSVVFNDQLFLAGYSEGGYVTLAAAEEIEKEPSHGLHLSAVAAGAGGYDLIGMLKGVTTAKHYSYPAYLAFVLMSYNNTYEWNKSLSYFFQPRYADALGKYMNGQYGGGPINAQLTTDVHKLFNADFFARLSMEGGEAELKDALMKNSITGWETGLPIRLYHGSKDEIIPYQNSEATLKAFQDSESRAVSLKIIPSGTHGSSFIPMLEDFVPWFLEIGKQ
jgi:pimeloyl-ACP methyl ester carboxylesterase